MKTLAVVGYPLNYSFSPAYFQQKFEQLGIKNYEYTAQPLEKIEDLAQMIKNQPNLVGFNVTNPYKTAIIPFLQHISPQAKAINAVNTVKIAENGALTGYNTDVIGFEQSISPWLNAETAAIVLGAGGASKAACFVLQKRNIPHTIIARNDAQNLLQTPTLEALKAVASSQIVSKLLVVNCTPVGTYPNVREMPAFPYQLLNEDCCMFDMVYNPAKTAFLQAGETQNCAIKNGLEMLHLQAEASWQIWTKNEL